ncbi:hypothetical protein [Schumannella luteola]
MKRFALAMAVAAALAVLPVLPTTAATIPAGSVVQGVGEDCAASLSGVTGDPSLSPQGDLLDGEGCPDAVEPARDAVVVPGAPQLAETGAGDRALLTLGGIGGALLLIGAAVFAFTVRRNNTEH